MSDLVLLYSDKPEKFSEIHYVDLFFFNYCANLKLQNYKYLNCPIITSGRR